MEKGKTLLDFRAFNGSPYKILDQLGFIKPALIDRDFQPLYAYFNLNRVDCALSRVLLLGYEYDDQYTVPEYQRELVWTQEQKQALAESIILGNPIGDFIVNEVAMGMNGDKEYRVIDGQQRINALREFVSGMFPSTSGIWFNKLKYWDARDFLDYRVFLYTGKELTIESEIKIYLGRNCGGTMHTAEEINKAATFLD